MFSCVKGNFPRIGEYKSDRNFGAVLAEEYLRKNSFELRCPVT
jgi:hypothetical protein